MNASFPGRVAALVMAVFFPACSPFVPGYLPKVHTVEDARAYFRQDPVITPLKNGTVRYDWDLRPKVYVPGQWVWFERLVGYDRDGWPVHARWQEFVPEHYEIRPCTVRLLAASDGTVQQALWRGEGCDAVLAPLREMPAR